MVDNIGTWPTSLTNRPVPPTKTRSVSSAIRLNCRRATTPSTGCNLKRTWRRMTTWKMVHRVDPLRSQITVRAPGKFMMEFRVPLRLSLWHDFPSLSPFRDLSRRMYLFAYSRGLSVSLTSLKWSRF